RPSASRTCSRRGRADRSPARCSRYVSWSFHLEYEGVRDPVPERQRLAAPGVRVVALVYGPDHPVLAFRVLDRELRRLVAPGVPGGEPERVRMALAGLDHDG